MGANASSHAVNNRQFSIELVTLKQGSDSVTIRIDRDDVYIKLLGGSESAFKLSSLLEDPDPSTPTHWKSVQSIARLSTAAYQRLRGRNPTLTVDYSEDLLVTFSFRVTGECPRGLLFIVAGSSAELQRVLSKGNDISTSNAHVVNPDPTLIVNGDGFKIYEWTWAYVAPPATGQTELKSIALPPTGGWKTSCYFGVYDAEEKQSQALATFDFFVSSPMPPPPTRAHSQTSSVALSGFSSRRESVVGSVEPAAISPLSPHSEGNESATSPRSSVSSPISPAAISPAGVGGHRRELSSGTGSSMLNLDEVDDEPAFRATIESLEKKTANLKHAVKKTSKQVDEYVNTARSFMHAGRSLAAAISAIPNVDVAVINLLNEVQKEVDKATEILLNQVQGTFIEQLDLLYRTQIKAAEGQKKGFDQEAKDFNASEQKYLSIKSHDKKLLEADSKWQEKKKNYELKRLDYYCHLKDLHGAHMERDLNFTFTVLAEKQMSFFKSIADKLIKKKDDLDTLSNKWKESNEKYNEEKREREERRKLIESKAQLLIDSTGTGEVLSDEENGRPLSADAAGNKFRGIRDLVQTHDSESASLGRRKKGYLFVAVAPTTGGGHQKATAGLLSWRKLWCVLSGGQLQECLLKKNQAELIHTVNLRFCTVREARNIDRRFAFELIGPHIGRRLYQASDAEDMKSWIVVIQNSIEGMLSGTSTIFENVGPDYVVPLGRASRAMTPSTENLPGGELDTQIPGRVLEIIRESDPANSVCAECGAKGPDWISINLGCILCIDCSGIHRSLGTHITKIRSLTLDTVSWTPELMAVLKNIGNAKSNSIWEATATPETKPTATDRRDLKAQYIRDKYVSRTFLDKASLQSEDSDPQKLLQKAAHDKDILAALKAMAFGADINFSNSSTHSALITALGYPSPPPPRRNSSIIQPLPLSSPSPTSSPHPISSSVKTSTSPSPRMVVAEFLLQNGAKIDAVDEVPTTAGPNVLCFDGEQTLPGVEGSVTRRMNALHFAALYHDVEAVGFLLGKGADPNIRDGLGKTPLELVEIGRRWRSKSAAASYPEPEEPSSTSDAGISCEGRLRDALAKWQNR
ncbi:uncharacterized protein SPPG_04481 [Spizellomyces punctatus DAOM BR117]|uniref:Uncharacterized protein n=1 Tax=Spizellomyces punctatus (strain DAOM BR117) TaxID=645134 RepID=A0A0L0HH80_SPIPD|nr:uncharacterized protein SPPG_04481 [Spizellomyces punctatus DAOM BR117]KND00139.1 hypothetical protein SPPG_04481 [Spizellomyces punctatus DAOM BR117]|eukprot:XP_016608178.1 hypothetical protein SPPG_04481 [Spizellomyces punctatus DAOM BR117]